MQTKQFVANHYATIVLRNSEYFLPNYRTKKVILLRKHSVSLEQCGNAQRYFKLDQIKVDGALQNALQGTRKDQVEQYRAKTSRCSNILTEIVLVRVYFIQVQVSFMSCVNYKRFPCASKLVYEDHVLIDVILLLSSFKAKML